MFGVHAYLLCKPSVLPVLSYTDTARMHLADMRIVQLSSRMS